MTERNGGTASDDDPTLESGAPRVQTVQRHYDPEQDEELTTAIVFAIAEAEGIPATDIRSPRLYDCVDAAALEETFFGLDVTDRPRRSVGSVEFRYDDYLVKVRSDGWIQVFEDESR